MRFMSLSFFHARRRKKSRLVKKWLLGTDFNKELIVQCYFYYNGVKYATCDNCHDRVTIIFFLRSGECLCESCLDKAVNEKPVDWLKNGF